MATIHDVAREAGVSISTVSYALSGKKALPESTRARVVEAARQLNYLPNAGARMLAGSRTRIFALTAPLHEQTYAPAHMAFVLAVTKAARRHDYDVLLLTADEATTGLRRVASSRLVDGILVLDVASQDERAALVLELGLPATLVGVPADPTGLVCVDLDFEAAAVLALDRLLDLGHRSVGLLGHPEAVYERGTNFARRFRDAFLARAQQLDVPVAFSVPGTGGVAVADALDALYAQQPGMTGLVMHCEERIQSAALDTLRARGVAVPQDLSVVSACSSFETGHFDPPLDVIPLTATETCERAVDLAVEQLDGPVEPRVELFAPQYHALGSVGPAPLTHGAALADPGTRPARPAAVPASH